MAGFNLYTSNRIERLIPILGDIISTPRKTLFEPETIVVQNKGMAQWLSLQIAEHFKICALCSFPFPNVFFKAILDKNFPEIPDQLPFDPDILLWKVYQQLPQLLENDHFAMLRSYLDNSQPLKLYNLSKKIADTFDQYSMYRPEMVRSWEDGEESNWQAQLWRELVKVNPTHRIHLKSMFIDKLKTAADLKNIPQRVCFFGISSLPPFFTDFIGILSQFCDIYYFLLNPSAEYWDDIVSEKELTKILRTKKRQLLNSTSIEKMHFEEGNSLLASMGIYGRDFLSRLHGLECIENPFTIAIEQKNLLTSIQSEILNLSDAENPAISVNDCSIQIHSCHSQIREIEVLHDTLVDLFQSNPDLTPSDIIVMTPEIELYSPHIKAVFGSNIENTSLSYSLCDQSINTESSIVKGFIELLEIINSRFTSISVINLFEIDEVREKFDLSIHDIALLKSWIKKIGIRWGIDGDSKESLSIPKTAENSWKAGLDQLLLGFALPVQDISLFNGIAGSDLYEGIESEILGKFLTMFKALLALNEKCSQSYKLDNWSQILHEALDQFFEYNIYNQQDVMKISQCISEFSLVQISAEFVTKVPFDVIKTHLQTQFSNSKISHGFLNGTITFCSLLPMRGIPFKVICLLGLNEATFPRKSHQISWNFISSSPKKGDRSPELEDRYLFLETLLSAREILYISYIGQDVQKNVEQHPSVCVEELLSYIEKKYSRSPAGAITSIQPPETIRNQLLFRHKLHAFNNAYFSNQKLFSYSTENFLAAMELQNPKKKPHLFFSSPLSDPPEEFRNITINDLFSFFSNPCRYILQKRLNVHIAEPDKELQDCEPFSNTGLEKYKLSEKIFLKNFQNNYQPNDLYSFFRTTNLLPHGTVGECEFDRLYDEIQEFSDKISTFNNAPLLEDFYFDETFDAMHLSGKISSILPNYILKFRNAQAKAKDYLRVWINHLCLNCYESSTYPKDSLFISKDAIIKFTPVSNAKELITDLLHFYKQGLQIPLQFFPQCSWTYASTIFVENKPPEIALQKALKMWNDNSKYNFILESDDPYISLCFPRQNPIDNVFESIATKILEPLIKNFQQHR